MNSNQFWPALERLVRQYRKFISNYDLYEDFYKSKPNYSRLDNRIIQHFQYSNDMPIKDLLELSESDFKRKMASSIIQSLAPPKWQLEEFENYDDKPFEFIFEGHVWRDLFESKNEDLSLEAKLPEINGKILGFLIEECTKDLFTPLNPETNSFQLDEFDLKLYNELISNPKLLKTLNWRTFEKLIADILESFEYEVELMQGTKDNGIDVIAIKKIDTFGIHRYLIQAKRWTNKVGIEPVQQLIFKRSDIGATKACLVTTSHFTKGAWELANKYKYILELKDLDKLQDWLRLASFYKR